MDLQQEIARRRTFAIISHPDAGKTTLTEKLLLFGGAIHVAGAVKSNKIKKGATSDFMEIERQRGISVATSVMGFEYKDCKINILDTPGHEDFAEDTYRTLTAVDSVIIVVDGAKGVETQTRKLMEVCRMRKTPVMVFINKLDRPCKDPFDLLDEIEAELKIKVRPLAWPISTLNWTIRPSINISHLLPSTCATTWSWSRGFTRSSIWTATVAAKWLRSFSAVRLTISACANCSTVSSALPRRPG